MGYFYKTKKWSANFVVNEVLKLCIAFFIRFDGRFFNSVLS